MDGLARVTIQTRLERLRTDLNEAKQQIERLETEAERIRVLHTRIEGAIMLANELLMGEGEEPSPN